MLTCNSDVQKCLCALYLKDKMNTFLVKHLKASALTEKQYCFTKTYLFFICLPIKYMAIGPPYLVAYRSTTPKFPNFEK